MTLQHFGTSNLYDNNAITKHKPHYPFEIPSNWIWATLECICSKIGSGSTPRGSNYATSGIPFFRSQNVYNDGIELTDIKYISEETHKSMISTEVLANDVLLNITGGSLGRCAVVPSDFLKGNVSQHVCILRPIEILPQYIHCFILSAHFSRFMKVTGSGREGLPKYSLEKMLIPIPPIKEQKRITNRIEEWMNKVIAIENGVLSLQEKLERIKSLILEMAITGKLVPQNPDDEPASILLQKVNPNASVSADTSHYIIPSSWVWVKLEDIFEINPKNHNNDDDECGFVPMANVQDGYSGKHTFEVRKWREVKKGYCHFQNGDIAVAKISPCFENLKSVIMRSLPNNIGAGTTELVILRSKEVFAPYFLYLFKSPWYISKGTVYFKGVVGQQRVSRDIFTKLAVPMPPLNEQKRIVAKVDELFALIDTIQQSLE